MVVSTILGTAFGRTKYLWSVGHFSAATTFWIGVGDLLISAGSAEFQQLPWNVWVVPNSVLLPKGYAHSELSAESRKLLVSNT